MRYRRAWLLGVVLSAAGVHAEELPYLPDLEPAEIGQARASLEAFKLEARGPYLRLRWFCADGTVQPPGGAPCAERGGGVQHAERNERALALGDLGIHAGTILQALTYEDFVDPERDQHRLKTLVLESYLFEIDDGWVLRQARYYRGARQIEDEERQGQRFLERLLGQPGWLRRNYFLAQQLADVVPHAHDVESRERVIVRNLATEIAAADPDFMPLRVKIHSFPSREDLSAVGRFAKSKNHPESVRTKLAALQGRLAELYDAGRLPRELARFSARVPEAWKRRLEPLARQLETRNWDEATPTLARLGRELRDEVSSSSDGRSNLLLLDLSRLFQDQAFFIATEQWGHDGASRSRRERLASLRDLLALSAGAGFLSERELTSLLTEVDGLLSRSALTALEYRSSLQYLARALDWTLSTVRRDFGGIVARYSLVEPLAVAFPDALLRSSSVLFVANELEQLIVDADRGLGRTHVLLDTNVSRGLRGLNPGVAVAPLEIIESHGPMVRLNPSQIYVIPDTGAELTPPAGILTLDAGNLLSHVQLLARNAAIPNATISSEYLPALREIRGEEVFYAVSPLGVVVLKRVEEMSERDRALASSGRRVVTSRVRLDVSRVRLGVASPIPLEELTTGDTGTVVGPKAGKLAELDRLFPGQVSRGLALPFGLFAEHVSQAHGDDRRPAHERILEAYEQAENLRRQGVPERDIDLFMFTELARFREAIVGLPWRDDMKRELVDAIRRSFGDSMEAGVFVRSDTNVEDLPQFSGAGLNLTVPHRRSVEGILEAVKQVWTSPFSERAYLWRKQMLEHEGRIYPSVLLLQSVPSEKSGVLITSGLQLGGTSDLTIAVAEGVSGAVDGENAETILVRSDGRMRMLSQAKAPYRKSLVAGGEGGVELLPARRDDTLLSEGDVRKLRDAVAVWRRRLPPEERERIWDMEFGFVGERLWLFQIRPFIRFRNTELLAALGELDAGLLESAGKIVSLEEAP